MTTSIWGAPDWKYLTVAEGAAADYSSATFDDSTWANGTAPFGVVGAPPVEPCGGGEGVTSPVPVPGTSPGYWYVNSSGKWQRGEKWRVGVTPKAAAGDSRWTVYLVTRYTDGSDWGSPDAAPVVASHAEYASLAVGAPADLDVFVTAGWEGGFESNGAPPGTTDQPASYYEKQQRVVVGVGLQRGFYSDRFQIPDGTVAADDGWAGVHDPARCLYYWGEEIATFSPSYTGTGTGTPIAALGTPTYPASWRPVVTVVPKDGGVWLRREVPVGGDLSVRMDGSAWVYLDGTLIGSRVGDGAAEATFTMPGPGLLAIHAEDDTDDPFGDGFYIDALVPIDAPATRLFPRDDAAGLSAAPRLYPPPKARRIVGGYL